MRGMSEEEEFILTIKCVIWGTAIWLSFICIGLWLLDGFGLMFFGMMGGFIFFALLIYPIYDECIF